MFKLSTVFALLFAACFNAAATLSFAAQPGANFKTIRETDRVDVFLNHGQLLKLPQNIKSILVANPEIASVQTPTASTVFVFGLNVGTTSIYALDANEQPVLALRVRVRHDLTKLTQQVQARYPEGDVEVLELSDSAIAVRGQVDTPIEASQVVAMVQGLVADASAASQAGQGQGAAQQGNAADQGVTVVNQLSVRLSAQVNIRVRVVEVSRSLSNELGMNWDVVFGDDQFRLATGSLSTLFDATDAAASVGTEAAQSLAGQLVRSANTFGYTNGNLTGLIRALTEQGMATVLAEPNLTAMSGETAAFGAGGEVPVVVITANNVSITFEEFGVLLKMTPTVLSANRITLHVAPEVSDISEEGAVTLDTGSTIPAFKMRKAETTVELASGQSFALAGMLRSTDSWVASNVPGLNRIPLLGRLFESQSRSKSETELVIIATAYIVDPVNADDLSVPANNLFSQQRQLPEQVTAGYLF